MTNRASIFSSCIIYTRNIAPIARCIKGGRLPSIRDLIKELDEFKYKNEDDDDAPVGLTKKRPKRCGVNDSFMSSRVV